MVTKGKTRDPEPSRGRLGQTLKKDVSEPEKLEKTRDPGPSRGRPEQTLKKDEPEPGKKSLSCVEG